MLICDSIFTAIDFESAGSEAGQTDSPIQVGTVSWNTRDKITDQWTSYIRTEQQVTWKAQKIHGITNAELLDAPAFLSLWPAIKQRLESRVIVAHSHGTEKRFLRAFPGHNFGPWIDTLSLARAAYPEMKKHSLSYLCDSFDLTPSIQKSLPEMQWHHALFDAMGSIALLSHIVTSFDLVHQPLDCLMQPDISRWSELRR